MLSAASTNPSAGSPRALPARAGQRLTIPSRSADNASVSYLGVVPTHRGHGDDLLAEITRQHADNGAPQITGTTDTTNAPMAAAAWPLPARL